MNSLHLERLFAQAYILGGSPCSGKSTIAELLKEKYGLTYYKADDTDPDHMRRCRPELHPVMHRYSKLGWDAIWSQSPQQLLADELTYYHERFALILEDLAGLEYSAVPVILEGAAFLPELVAGFPVDQQRTVFMLPTPEFQLHHYSQRPWIKGILSECRDADQAFDNWMQRDMLFAEHIQRQAAELGFASIVVDGSLGIQAQFDAICARLGL